MLAFWPVKQKRQQEIRRLLGKIHPPYDTLAKYGSGAFGTIISILRDPRDRLGSRAIELASRIGGEGSILIMKSAAQHENPAVRAALVYALPRMSSAAVQKMLLELLLKDQDSRIVFLAVRATRQLPPDEGINSKISILAREHPSEFVRNAAASAIGPSS